MSNGKNHNSVIFLTTLGVYLGLVLVGATPQVLAQAVTTKQFNVKNEVDPWGEFDGNPDIEELKSLITTALEGTIASFISNVRASEKNSVSRAALRQPHSLRTVRNFCAEDWIEVTDPLKSMSMSDDSVIELHRDLDVGSRWEFTSVPNFIQVQDGPPKQKFCKAFWVSTALSSDELSVKLLFSRTDSLNAFRLAAYLNDFLYDRAHYFQDPITRQVYQYTRATSDYANVLIFTRLPRAGLDALLASDAK